MTQPKTILSAGIAIRHLITQSAAVQGITRKVFPVVVDEAVLPYVVYRRAALAQVPVKGLPGASQAQVEVACFAKDYGESVRLAEAVNAALDGQSLTLPGGLTLRSCRYVDGEEGWQDDAYMQRLVYDVRI
ncbi:hypothetical protein EVA_01083 [gut metagenome]|uniref:DUF3168 domain-containing protein n=1 Tax=gut metagenome TaxID=749906 RepID=J9GQC7_9ZZZZ